MSKKELNKLLKKYYGYDSLKEEQYKIISSVIEQRDVCAILPTGFGKSICYQLPFLFLKKCVIVVSPLIALMEDQVRQLEELHIPVVALNSNNGDKDMSLIKIYSGETKIIYTSPEYIAKNDKFISKLIKKDLLALIAIDESHCASSWSQTFRPDYQKLSCLKAFAPNIPMLALTATATEKVRDDICEILKLDNPVHITGNFDRPNLKISISQRISDTFETKITPLIMAHKDEKILVYCKSKDDTDKVAKDIKKLGITCESYHAGKNNKIRNEIQDRFTTGKTSCIVATIAFGLGVNIPDIRLVIHYNCPNDMESYYQEIGRGGRDGQPCDCHMYYSNKDFMISKYFINDIKSESFKAYKEEELKLMQQYIYTKACRRDILLKHFDPTSTIKKCNNCDMCCDKSQNLIDCTGQSYLFLGFVSKHNESYGMGTVVKVLRGSGCKKILQHKQLSPEFFGQGDNKSENWWKQLFNQLMVNDYVKEKSIQGCKYGSVVGITQKGQKWLNDFVDPDECDKIMLDIPLEKAEKAKSVPKVPATYEEAMENFNNGNMDMFNAFDTFSACCTKVKTHNDNGKKIHTQDITNDLIKNGKSLKAIAKARGLGSTTIESHVVELIKKNKIDNLTKFDYDKKIYDEITKFDIHEDTKLKEIYEYFDGKHSYMHIKLTLHLMTLSKNERNRLLKIKPRIIRKDDIAKASTQLAYLIKIGCIKLNGGNTNNKNKNK
jgi:RecQ family ATP-dependent DNA helicase